MKKVDLTMTKNLIKVSIAKDLLAYVGEKLHDSQVSSLLLLVICHMNNDAVRPFYEV